MIFGKGRTKPLSQYRRDKIKNKELLLILYSLCSSLELLLPSHGKIGAVVSSVVVPVSFVGTDGVVAAAPPAAPSPAPAYGTWWHRISSKLIPKSHFISTC
jgi:hypothetical protein